MPKHHRKQEGNEELDEVMDAIMQHYPDPQKEFKIHNTLEEYQENYIYLDQLHKAIGTQISKSQNNKVNLDNLKEALSEIELKKMNFSRRPK